MACPPFPWRLSTEPATAATTTGICILRVPGTSAWRTVGMPLAVEASWSCLSLSGNRHEHSSIYYYIYNYYIYHHRYNVTNSTRPGHGSAAAPPGGVTLPPPTSAPTAAPDQSLCWTSCFQSSNSYHQQFLEIVQKLQTEQQNKNVKVNLSEMKGSIMNEF